MVTLSIRIQESDLQKLEEKAKDLGITPEELARIGIEQILSPPDDDLERIMDETIEEYAELYRRLA